MVEILPVSDKCYDGEEYISSRKPREKMDGVKFLKEAKGTEVRRERNIFN